MNRRKFISSLGIVAALPAAKFLGVEIPTSSFSEADAGPLTVEQMIHQFDKEFVGVRNFWIKAESDVVEEARAIMYPAWPVGAGYAQSSPGSRRINFSIQNLPLRVSESMRLVPPFDEHARPHNSSRGLSVDWLNAPYTLVHAASEDRFSFVAVVRPRFNPVWKNVPDSQLELRTFPLGIRYSDCKYV